MKLTKTEKANIEVLLHHARIDMDFGEGGSYGDGVSINRKELTMARKAYTTLSMLLASN